MKKAFDKKVNPREFRECDLVLRKIMPFNVDSRGKWTPNYEVSCIVKKSFFGSVLILETTDGEEFPCPMNADAIKKYFTKRNKRTAC